MGDVRAFTPHVRWTAEEEAILLCHYATASLSDLDALLPGRHRRMIACKANGMGLARTKSPPRTLDQVREAKRLGMAKRRIEDGDRVRAKQREWVQANRDRLNGKHRENTARRLFWGRALRLRGVTALDLWKLWKRQRGLCALTGAKLDRSAEIDHRLPKVRGGTDDISNLQWVTHQANFAKRDLTDEEFHALCSDVFRWVGRRIEMVEKIAADLEKEQAA